MRHMRVLGGRGPRILLIAAASVTSAISQAARSGSLDPIFERMPVEKWASERSQGRFRWSTKVWPSFLTFHQRLRSRISIQIDGRDISERRGRGKLVMLMQFKDREGG